MFTQLQSAAAEAQSVLAQLGGAAPGATNALLDGRPVLGVWGTPETVEIMRPGGGYSRRTQTSFSITRASLAQAPTVRTILVRTDLSPRAEYRIDRVATDDPLHYRLTAYRIGDE